MHKDSPVPRNLPETTEGSEPCPYLEGRIATFSGGLVPDGRRLHPAAYEALLSQNYRRSGWVIYRPECGACRACRSLRVPVQRFSPTRSQRRVGRRNADLSVTVEPPSPTDEKYHLYRRYLDHQHDGKMSPGYEAFESFLYQSPTDTLEVLYRSGGRIVCASIVDRVPGGLSSVYVYFDPRDARRSPGTYSAIWEIDYGRRLGLSYYYLGYYVAGCGKMEYKARLRPNEILDGDAGWVPFHA